MLDRVLTPNAESAIKKYVFQKRCACFDSISSAQHSIIDKVGLTSLLLRLTSSHRSHQPSVRIVTSLRGYFAIDKPNWVRRLRRTTSLF
jgi:hypothetical protein